MKRNRGVKDRQKVINRVVKFVDREQAVTGFLGHLTYDGSWQFLWADTFEELRAFEQHAAVLQQMQTRVEEKMGFGVGFPGGLSQDAVEHTLSGRLGLPPGGQIQRKQSPQ